MHGFLVEPNRLVLESLLVRMNGKGADDVHLLIIDLDQSFPHGELLILPAGLFIAGREQAKGMLVFTAAQNLVAEHLNDIPLLVLHKHLNEIEKLEIVIRTFSFQLNGTTEVHCNDTVALSLSEVLVT
ncbi:hypothetical protein DSECCO2_593080 [anaerobic digester metagenome]